MHLDRLYGICDAYAFNPRGAGDGSYNLSILPIWDKCAASNFCIFGRMQCYVVHVCVCGDGGRGRADVCNGLSPEYERTVPLKHWARTYRTLAGLRSQSNCSVWRRRIIGTNVWRARTTSRNNVSYNLFYCGALCMEKRIARNRKV